LHKELRDVDTTAQQVPAYSFRKSKWRKSLLRVHGIATRGINCWIGIRETAVADSWFTMPTFRFRCQWRDINRTLVCAKLD